MTSPNPQAPNIGKYVGYYVALRDKIKAIETKHKEELAPLKETLETLNGALLGHLNAVGADNASTPSGTVYRTAKKSASLADKTAFWTWVVTQGKFEMLDYKANPTAVEDYINEQVEAAKSDPSIVPAPPPGVNYSVMHVVGVRRA